MKEREFIMTHKVLDIQTGQPDQDVLSKCRLLINDDDYFQFLEDTGNGGFFFGLALQLFGLNEGKGVQSSIDINDVLQKEFGKILEGFYSFGQDAFGNQFLFHLKSNDVLFFNIETGRKQLLGNGFRRWMEAFASDYDYYSGMSYMESWRGQFQISINERIQAKKPFVIGGKYHIENFIVKRYPDYLSYNADIAKQIINIPDGARVVLKLKNATDK